MASSSRDAARWADDRTDRGHLPQSEGIDFPCVSELRRVDPATAWSDGALDGVRCDAVTDRGRLAQHHQRTDRWPLHCRHKFLRPSPAGEKRSGGGSKIARCEVCGRRVKQPSRSIINGRIVCALHNPRPDQRANRDRDRGRRPDDREPRPMPPGAVPAGVGAPVAAGVAAGGPDAATSIPPAARPEEVTPGAPPAAPTASESAPAPEAAPAEAPAAAQPPPPAEPPASPS
jgi:hypothetical protein